MLKKILFIGAFSTLFAGCASVPTSTDHNAVQQLKLFPSPAEGQAGLYLYRSNSVVGASLKKDIWVDGNCIGETARGIFFYTEVMGGQEHEIATESEFSPNIIKLNTESGKNYFIQQYIKPGAIVGGANLKVVDESTGKAEVQKLQLAEKGTCSKELKKS